MRTYTKILATTLPLMFVVLLVSVGMTYSFARTALRNLADTWLETRLEEALEIVAIQEQTLRDYGLETIPASLTKAKMDTQAQLAAINIGEQGFFFAVNSQGTVTVHPVPDRIGTSVVANPWFRDLKEARGALAYSLEGKRYLARYARFEPWQWVVFAVDTEEEVYGAVNRMQPYVVALLVSSTLALILSMALLTRRLTEPLRLLTEGAERIGQGNLTTRVAVRRRDEFGKLAEVFNQMVSQLERSHQQLERRVSERTAELTRANEQLSREMAEREQATAALVASESRLGAILRASPVGIGLVVDRKLDWVNGAVYELFGHEPGSLIGQDASVFYPDGQQYDRIRQEIFAKITHGEVGQIETPLFRKDGTSIECLLRACPLDPTAPDRGVIYTVTDISEIKRLQTQLQRARKMEALGTLAGGVAHDLNNILSGIVSYPEILLLDLPEDSPLRKPIRTMQKSGEQAAAVVQDLLTMARRGVMKSEVLNLNQVIAEQMDSAQFGQLKAHMPEIAYRVSLDPGLLHIRGSDTHIAKSVMNLLTNAAESMPEGGMVSISTENRYVDRPLQGYDAVNEGEYAVIRVIDQGIGMSRDEMERIFEPFYTKKRMGRSGSGLGMAVVWGTIKDHAGYITVASSPGQGSTFELYFPAVREGLPSMEEDTSLLAFQGGGESVLIVDDSDIQREVALNILHLLGYQASSVDSGEEAVAYLTRQPVDLVILDMIMEPGMDGLETYRQIAKIRPGQRLIIASGFSQNERVREIQRASGCRYVKKPYTIAQLGAALRKALEGDSAPLDKDPRCN